MLGIEAVGVVDAAPDGDLAPGQQVATLMGGMGRVFDGGYAEYTVVPRGQVVPFTSDLPWHVIGAVPETLQTAYGSLTTGLDLSEGQTLLVRGGTSSVGLAAITVAKDREATVVATTRRPERTQALLVHGADHVVVDDGEIAGQVRALLESGVDAALELVGTPTLPDTLRATRVHGTVCFTGMLSNEWTVPDFYPIDYIPRGVRLTAYGGDSADLPPRCCRATWTGSPPAPPASDRSGCTSWRTSVRRTRTSNTTAPSASTSSSPTPAEDSPRPPGRCAGLLAPDAGSGWVWPGDTRPPRRRRAASPNRLLSSIPGARRSAGPAQKGYGWSDGSIVIHLSSVNSLITARPSKRPYPLSLHPAVRSLRLVLHGGAIDVDVTGLDPHRDLQRAGGVSSRRPRRRARTRCRWRPAPPHRLRTPEPRW